MTPAGLTKLCGNNRNIVPSSLFSVQAFEQEDGSIPWMDVEKAINVSATVDRVPVKSNTTRNGESVRCQKIYGWNELHFVSWQPYQVTTVEETVIYTSESKMKDGT